MENNGEAGPSKKARYTTFSERWNQIPEYSAWIKKKDDFTAMCKLCQTEIIIKYEGTRSLDKHKGTKKHQKILNCQKVSQSIASFAKPKEINEETQIARAELVSVFHNVVHGLSYNSLDCQLKLCSSIYCDSNIASKISCGRTKSAAITRNVLAPYAQQKVANALKESWYYSVSSDASNIGNVKTYPYAVQYFDVDNGICKKILDFYEDPAEASKDIFANIIRITKENDLKIQQISSYSADNAAVNYGVRNSVFQKLTNENEQIVKANCNCHIINNCIKYALNVLSVDIENIVIKTFNEFSSSAQTTEKLKQCFEFASIEYKNLLRHVPTRWLSLLPAIDRLIYSWPAVKMYFLKKGEKNCRKELWEFVSKGILDFDLLKEDEECLAEGLSEAYLFFIHNIMHEFHASILALENDSCTILDLHGIMTKLMSGLNQRVNDCFYGSKANSIIKSLSLNERETFELEANQFLQNAVKYLEKRYDFGEKSVFKQIAVLNIKNSLLSWNNLAELPNILKISNSIDIDMLYSDYCCLRKVFEELPKDKSIDKIWALFFKKCEKNNVENLYKLVSFVFSIPISNAYCERTFSILNNLYTKDRNRMSFDLIKAELIIRQNFDENCKNFQQYLLTPDAACLIKSVTKNTKYMWQNK